MQTRPIEVPRGAFAFCRWSLALCLWAALVFAQSWLVLVVGLILGASAVTGVGRAPMILLWRTTVHRVWPSRSEVVDERAMRFAHALGALLCFAVLVLLATIPSAGRALLAAVAVVKTFGALGFCTASRAWDCILVRGGCCAALGRRDD